MHMLVLYKKSPHYLSFHFQTYTQTDMYNQPSVCQLLNAKLSEPSKCLAL